MSWYRRFAVLSVILLTVIAVATVNILAAPKEHTAGVIFLPDGKLLPMLLKDFDKASEEIKCALYMFRTDGNPSSAPVQILNAMQRALERGVKVGVIFDIEKNAESKTTPLSTKYNTHTSKVLKNAGAVVVFDSPERRLHTKMCVVDKEITFIGSHNYTFSALAKNAEVTVRIRSPEIAAESLKYMKDLGLK